MFAYFKSQPQSNCQTIKVDLHRKVFLLCWMREACLNTRNLYSSRLLRPFNPGNTVNVIYFADCISSNICLHACPPRRTRNNPIGLKVALPFILSSTAHIETRVRDACQQTTDRVRNTRETNSIAEINWCSLKKKSAIIGLMFIYAFLNTGRLVLKKKTLFFCIREQAEYGRVRSTKVDMVCFSPVRYGV